jgi:hypothetical protein
MVTEAMPEPAVGNCHDGPQYKGRIRVGLYRMLMEIEGKVKAKAAIASRLGCGPGLRC